MASLCQERTGHEPEPRIKAQERVEHGNALVDLVGAGRSSDLRALLDGHLNAIGRPFLPEHLFSTRLPWPPGPRSERIRGPGYFQPDGTVRRHRVTLGHEGDTKWNSPALAGLFHFEGLRISSRSVGAPWPHVWPDGSPALYSRTRCRTTCRAPRSCHRAPRW